MKTFLGTLYFLFLFISIFIIIYSITYYHSIKDTNSFTISIIVLLLDIVVISIWINSLIKIIIAKYKAINNTLCSIYNHQINTHNKVLDGLSVVKESSKNILALDKIIKATERQGKVNQDTLSNQRDTMRHISSCIGHIETVDREFLESMKNMSNLLSLINSRYDDNFKILLLIKNKSNELSSLVKSDLDTHIKFLDIYKDNNNNLVTIGEEFKNTNINLEIIKDNQKYLVEQLVKYKGKTKGKKEQTLNT